MTDDDQFEADAMRSCRANDVPVSMSAVDLREAALQRLREWDMCYRFIMATLSSIDEHGRILTEDERRKAASDFADERLGLNQ